MILVELSIIQINQNYKNKIPETSRIVIKTDYNAKINEIENTIPSISGLATNDALTTVENKIPNISSLVKKQIITQNFLHLKRNLLTMIMINILEFNNLAERVFNARLAQANLVAKTGFDDQLKILN